VTGPSRIPPASGWHPRGQHHVEIHYLRPPADLRVYRQELIYETGTVKVTLARFGDRSHAPLVIGDEIALDGGAQAIWFTFPGLWHDIGIFHRLDGTPTGIYANMISPCLFGPGGVWETTDLFLDLWIPGKTTEEWDAIHLLDAEELNHAESLGSVSPDWARRARHEAGRLQTGFREGSWPPPIVTTWLDEGPPFPGPG